VNNKLRDVLAYILKNYPYKDDLSNARVTKMIYLVDWRYANIEKEQLTDIRWKFDRYGPFVWDVKDLATRDSLFEVIPSTNTFGDDKTLLKYVGKDYDSDLSEDEVTSIQKIINYTKDMSWGRFIQFIYSTFPIITSPRFSDLDLVEKAKQYKAQMEQ